MTEEDILEAAAAAQRKRPRGMVPARPKSDSSRDWGENDRIAMALLAQLDK